MCLYRQTVINFYIVFYHIFVKIAMVIDSIFN